ncbi:MAG: DUF1440 domain-containing protein [Ardenticatenaceae bacterium]|nr:DUF1440 domain-containing protein [Ardenticatenaceae bacterium]
MSISSLFAGAAAGFIATVPMTIVMLLLHRLLPWLERYPLPPSRITARIAHRIGLRKRMSQEQHLALTALAHFGYGATAGAVYAPIAASWHPAPLVGGIAFGLIVWLASYLGLLPALAVLPPATEHPARRNALMIAAHIVWGATLGLLVDRLGGRRRGESQPVSEARSRL